MTITICEHCGQETRIVRSEKGAAYMHERKNIGLTNIKITSAWYSDSEMRQNKYTKYELRDELAKRGIKIGENPINARVSELVAVGIVKSTKHERIGHNTITKPAYYLDICRAEKILNAGGQIA